MVDVFLGLGSNINREQHIRSALTLLQDVLGELVVSPVYESEAVGFEGDPFYNLVVGVTTELPLKELIRIIKQIEDQNGRDRSGPKFGPRSLDIDVLTYGELVGVHEGIELPRPEITENAYVLLPLSEIATDGRLPGGNVSYKELWAAYDKNKQQLTRVNFPLLA